MTAPFLLMADNSKELAANVGPGFTPHPWVMNLHHVVLYASLVKARDAQTLPLGTVKSAGGTLQKNRDRHRESSIAQGGVESEP
jgi:hypothetical protein